MDVTNGTEDGALLFETMINGSPVELLDIGATAASTITVKDGAYNFNIASHDGTNGLALAGTVVTAAGADLNILLGCAGNGLAVADLTKLAAVTATAAEINYLDGTAGVSAANKAIVADGNGDFEMQDNDKIFFGDGADCSIYWDASRLQLATNTSGAPITIGHTTSEVTIADNLTVTGDLTVSGATFTVDSTTIHITSSFTFEGALPNAHETVLGVVEPTADATLNLPALSAGTYYVPVLAAASTAAIAATPAEIDAACDASGRTAAAIAVADDHFLFCDGGATGATRVESIADLMTAIAGDGLAASSGVLAVGVDDSGIELNSDALRLKDNGVTLAKMAGLARGKLIVGDSGGDPSALALGSITQFMISDGDDPVYRTMSGDATLGADGALTIAATSVEGSMLNNNVVSGLTDIGAAIASTDELLISDAGTIRRTDVSRLKTFVNSQDVQLVDDSGTLATGMNYWADLGGAESATLPASPVVGDIVYVKAPSNCSSTNTVTINKAGSQTIDGSASIILESPFAAVSLCYVVSNVWRIF
jgi:hypothetical protein